MSLFPSRSVCRLFQLGLIVAIIACALHVSVVADTATTNSDDSSSPGSTISITDDPANSDSKPGKHIVIESHSKHADDASIIEDNLIPVVAIVATFGTPVLIVFFVCYFQYRRRQETLALAREFLNKGMPVPPELLDPSQMKSGSNANSSPVVNRGQCRDLRRGFQLTFIGLGITLAFYIDDPHSTTWGWGLIPFIMGLGYLASGWFEERRLQNVPLVPINPPPPPPAGTL